MAQKVNPKVFRIGTIYGWDSKWFNRKDYKKFLQQDVKIRVFLRKELKEANVDKIEIDRGGTNNVTTVTVHSGKPGVIIGRAGAGVEELKKKIKKEFFRGKKVKLDLNVVEVTHPSLSSNIVMQQMIADLEKRMPFRRILKSSIERVQKAGGLGVKVAVSGRLNGAEIARREQLSWGSVPLQNLRADIDYASDFARTMFGTIGVKVWIYRGEVFDGKKPAALAAAPKPQSFRERSSSGTGRGAPRGR